MGIYLNPGNESFQESIESEIYVDKTELIAYTNRVLKTRQKFVCVSRPRRFGKSMAAEMLAAYYGRNADSRKQFENLKIGKDASFMEHLNQYNVIFLNMQDFLSENSDIEDMQNAIEEAVLWDLREEYPDIHYYKSDNLIRSLMDIYGCECSICIYY